MYRVAPNQGLWNAGLPSYSTNGDGQTNPPLALNLHYLLTAYGTADFEAEILLGYAMHILHERPVLDRAAIRRALDTEPAGPVDPASGISSAFGPQTSPIRSRR